MIAVVQRVTFASVTINNIIKSKIDEGLLILLGITHTDSEADAEWLVKKIVNMRIFSDENDKMNLSVMDVNGDLLLVSQFTLISSTKKGNRPSFIDAAKPEQAIPLYNQVISLLEKEINKNVKTGEFGADMKVKLVNNGPVTIVIDSKNKI